MRPASARDLRGALALVTGATSGLGFETARALARSGASVLLAARTREQGETAAGLIRAADPAATVSVVAGDLSTRAGVRALAQEVAAARPRLDVLINNAAAVRAARHETADGVEWTLAVNHLAPFLLTRLVVPAMSEGARVVFVTSDAHRDVSLDFDDLELRRAYDPLVAYRRSKLANILCARALAARAPALSVVAVAPGIAATGIVREAPAALRSAWAARGRPAAEVALLIVEAASAASPAPGDIRYFSEGREIPPSTDACDDGLATRLWNASAQLTHTPASPVALDVDRHVPD